MRDQLPYIGISILLVVLGWSVLGLPLGYTAIAVFVGWPVIGTLVTADDDLRGGYFNPDGSAVPPWMELVFWGYLSIRAALAALAFAIEAVIAGKSCWGALVCVALLLSLGLALVYGPSSGRSASG